jgi:hypothetical protein
MSNHPTISLDRPNKPAVGGAPVDMTADAQAPANTSTIGARIPARLHKAIKRFCLDNDIEMQQFVQQALTNHLAALQGE